jgi:hypothetical protein
MAPPSGPVWIVPRRRDPDFVGREGELAALQSALAATGSSALTQPTTVHGLGGVGKTLLGNLGIVARRQGDLSGARALQERALRIQEKAYGPEHTHVANTLANLGGVLAKVGEPDKAAPLVGQALGIFRRAVGDQHPHTIEAGVLLQNILKQIRDTKPLTAPGGDMIKVLFLAANPAGTTPLALDEEIRAIDAKIRGSEHRDRLTLVSHWAVRLDDLSGLLMRQRPHVVHFSGHGASTGEIVLLRAGRDSQAGPPRGAGRTVPGAEG